MKWILLLAAGGAAYIWWRGAQVNPSGGFAAQLTSGVAATKTQLGIPCCDDCAKGGTPCGGQATQAQQAATTMPQVIQLGGS